MADPFILFIPPKVMLFIAASFLSLALSASAAAIAGRQSTGLSCSTITTGPLVLFSQDQSLPSNGSFASLHPTGQFSSTSFLVSGGAATQYEFQQCNSTFTGPSSLDVETTTIHFGRIVPVGQESNCLTAPLQASAGSPFLLVNDACVTTDDQELLTQFWSLSTIDTTVDFLGVSGSNATYNNDGVKNFSLQLDEYAGQQAVEVAASAQPLTSTLQLRFN